MGKRIEIRLIAAILAVFTLTQAAFAACQPGKIELATEKGRVSFDVAVADDFQERGRGLMFVKEMADSQGMLFIYGVTRPVSFWMKNTPLPLDIIFIGQDRKIINIAAQTTPYSLDSVSALGPTSAVLEIPGGRAAELGIGPGDAVAW